MMTWGRDMDRQPSGAPLNPFPTKCPLCKVPDVDFVARPYLLGAGIWAPDELASAMRGNFLVRERVRRILELVVPGACIFHPTTDAKSKRPAPWYLAVPTQKLKALYPPLPRPFCPKCRAPKEGDLDQFHSWKRMKKFDSGGVDLFKTLAWEARPNEGIKPLTWTYPERDLYFSTRLEQLLIRAKVRARLARFFKEVRPGREDERWVQEKLKLLAEHGLIEGPKAVGGEPSAATQRWFKQFLKRNAIKGAKTPDFAAAELKRKLPLPDDYKAFFSSVGPMSFRNVIGLEEMEETRATVLRPEKLDFKNFRRGKVPNLEGEDAKVDGVMFAATDFGDCFVFDVSAETKDYPVYWYRHEENAMEPYARNFAECIKRFVRRA